MCCLGMADACISPGNKNCWHFIKSPRPRRILTIPAPGMIGEYHHAPLTCAILVGWPNFSDDEGHLFE